MATTARGYLSIGEVLVNLKPEFPDVTISKIRFLESEGLISPERTASGYRKFHEQDVERLRTILKLQRDEYLPLRVIRDRLDGDSEVGGSPAPKPPQAESDDSERPPDVQLGVEELGTAAGVDPATVESLESFGLLRSRSANGDRVFDGDALLILRIAKEFFKYGVEPRHLTMYRHFAEREAMLFQQIVLPMLRQRNPEARRAAAESLEDLTNISRRLKQALLRANLRTHLGD